MFSSSKNNGGKKKHDLLSQFGVYDTPNHLDIDAMNVSGEEDFSNDIDSDLEAELAAVISGEKRTRKDPTRPKSVAAINLDTLVAESLKDVDENISSGDEDDPNLLDELNELINEPMQIKEESPSETNEPNSTVMIPTTQMSQADLIKSRIEMYKIAEANANQNNDASRARRLGRGLKTLNDLLRKANAGKPINADDIPPEVVTKTAQHPPAPIVNDPPASIDNDPPTTQPLEDVEMPDAEELKSEPLSPAPSPPTPAPDIKEEVPHSPAKSQKNVDESKINVLLTRQKEYKIAALTAKKAGNTETALKYVKVIKMFDAVIKAAQDGQEVDLSDMPPPPDQLDLSIFDAQPSAAAAEPASPAPAKENAESQGSAPAASNLASQIPEAPKTILEALIQRLELYKSIEQTAKNENNNSKARRFGRIVKQYEDAIKLYKAGKPVPFDDLPTPPNFPPIPTSDAPVASPAAPVRPPRPSKPGSTDGSEPSTSQPVKPRLQKQESRSSGNHSNTSLMHKPIALIKQRQNEYRSAALEAKKLGEMEAAKEYLRVYKGLDKLLDIAQGGLPIDLATIPIAPAQRAELDSEWEHVGKVLLDDGDMLDISDRVEKSLVEQLTLCIATRDHYKAIGDVAEANRFENLAVSSQRDLDMLKLARRGKSGVPVFHMETKTFNILRCNTDLTDNEIEIEVIRGLQYNITSTTDTYLRLEFPYPQDSPQKVKSQVVRDVDSPEYKEKFKLDIAPKNRQCQRVFKRHSVKIEIYTKGCSWPSLCCGFDPLAICCFSGFLRSDTLLGTVAVKLQPLEMACEIHGCFPLMDGRKSVGGQLEVKVRLRNPLLTKQMERIKQNWIVIDKI